MKPKYVLSERISFLSFLFERRFLLIIFLCWSSRFSRWSRRWCRIRSRSN